MVLMSLVIMYEFLSVNTTIKLTIQVYVYLVFIITTCFDPDDDPQGSKHVVIIKAT
jgi:hypothetical protein